MPIRLSDISDVDNNVKQDKVINQKAIRLSDVSGIEKQVKVSPKLEQAVIPKQEDIGIIGLPGAERTERLIAERPSAVTALQEEALKPYDFREHPIQSAFKPLVTGLKTAAIPFERGEAAIANIGMELQETEAKPIEFLLAGYGGIRTPRIKKIVEAQMKGLTGERKGQLGDIMRRVGAPEPLAAATGFFASLSVGKLFDKSLLKGEVSRMAKDSGKWLSSKRPRIMNDKWITEQSQLGQNVLNGVDDVLSKSYDNIYSKVNKIPVDFNKIDDILLKSQIDDTIIGEIDNIVGRVDTVEKAKMVVDILRKRVPRSFYVSGGTTGKGGLANLKIRSMFSSRAIKEVMNESISKVDKSSGSMLKNLDKFAHTKVYPALDKLRTIYGKDRIPKTGPIVSIFGKSLGRAGERKFIRDLPKLTKEMNNYIAQGYKADVIEVFKNSSQLLRNMEKFRARQLLKAGAVGAGLLIGGRYGISKFRGGGE
jgi:hypothetical protein